jgi:hypothetical protein
MNSAQLKVLEETPISYRTIMERAFTTNRKSLAIKAFCLHCVGYLRVEVKNCTSFGCPLHPHRPYRDDKE